MWLSRSPTSVVCIPSSTDSPQYPTKPTGDGRDTTSKEKVAEGRIEGRRRRGSEGIAESRIEGGRGRVASEGTGEGDRTEEGRRRGSEGKDQGNTDRKKPATLCCTSRNEDEQQITHKRRGNEGTEEANQKALLRRTESHDTPEGDSRGQEGDKEGSKGQGARSWGCRSEADLPSAVAECFEDTTLLARLQTRLLSLVGRANRYRIQRVVAAPIMSLDALRRKVKEARTRLLHPPSPTPSSTSSSHPSTPESPRLTPDCPGSPASRLSSPGIISPDDSLGKYRRGGGGGGTCSSLQRYWSGERGGGVGDGGGGEEEMELLQQYLNLQQLANCRKHSAQLRRIRDSLLVRVRSRPNSFIKPLTPLDAFSTPAHAHTGLPHISHNPGGTPHPPYTPTPAHTPAKDRQALRNFLMDIGFVQYYALLNRHGYDLTSAAHMDALDLASVGITEPLHRMAIKFELDLVKRPTPVPESVPETCQEWLTSLGLQEYTDNFHANGIYCPLAALGLGKRDLQVMGVYMLGHRKKLLLAIAGLKEALLRKD